MTTKMTEAELQKKIRIQNIERCINCALFNLCVEVSKEDIVDCEKFEETTVPYAVRCLE